MKLGKKTLDDWLKRIPNKELKKGDTFPFHSKYTSFKDYLDNNLHQEVTKSAILAEMRGNTDFDKVIYLNDHGPKHIETVIERASQLVNNGDLLTLNAREVFLLLNAIQVHDVGNFYGRYSHERKVLQAIKEGLAPVLFDSTEVNYINEIAQVHGGKVKFKDGSETKNTIQSIRVDTKSDGYDIRLQLLAAILRFADELADDRHRCDIKALKEGTIPKGSEVFHAYAFCLDTVKVDHTDKKVELHFKIPKEFVFKKFGKISKGGNSVKRVYLIDEIFQRALKMHYERIYCSKFWRRNIDIDKIWVRMEFYATPSGNSFKEDELVVHRDITFTLQDNEYPTDNVDIYSMCPDLKYADGTNITGQRLAEKIKNKNEVNSIAKKKIKARRKKNRTAKSSKRKK